MQREVHEQGWLLTGSNGVTRAWCLASVCSISRDMFDVPSSQEPRIPESHKFPGPKVPRVQMSHCPKSPDSQSPRNPQVPWSPVSRCPRTKRKSVPNAEALSPSRLRTVVQQGQSAVSSFGPLSVVQFHVGQHPREMVSKDPRRVRVVEDTWRVTMLAPCATHRRVQK